MPLLSIFRSDPSSVAQFNIEQIISAAGDGVLKDKSDCSSELREYLSQVGTERIGVYIDYCLASAFQKGGMALQDLVNELGRRLDYNVINGLYQGVVGGVGYDGLWQAPEGQSVIVEVKTTDAYRFPLDTLATYRRKLMEQGMASSLSSILIVVGRQDTGELEAQIRGSRHAWDIRVISAESLIKLALLKEASEAAETGLKIRSLLMPMEYTRLDRMVDVMFTAVTDVELASESEMDNAEALEIPLNSPNAAKADGGSWKFTDPNTLQSKRSEIIEALGSREQTPLIRRSRALYWSGNRELRVACAMSKIYAAKAAYWYAFHPEWDEFLSQGSSAYFTLGCMDREEAFALPYPLIKSVLSQIHTTTKDDRTYWHVRLAIKGNDVELVVPKSKGLSLRQYSLALR